ncbi:hypothetical protein WK76_15645 [Burkholderia ubonensis]|nr:hypothetical protein WK76_15645 [Burkholderia ubonensis]
MFGDRGQLFVMHNQYALHVGLFVLAKRPRLAAFGTRDAGIQYSLCSSIQVEIGARSRFASHEKREIDNS